MLVLDAGTGARGLGDYLITSKAHSLKDVHVLLSHFHTDHICGLPFFAPLYQAKVNLHLYGPKGFRRQPSAILASFFAEEFFPIAVTKLPAQLDFHPLGNETFEINPFQITSFYVNHPGSALGYVIQSKQCRIAYLSDHEPMKQYQHIKQSTLLHYEKLLLEHLGGVDLLIHDAHFTDAEYPNYRGWGHSPWSEAVALAVSCRVKHLVLFHHAPTHSDAMLKKNLRQLQAQLKKKKSPLKVSLAREGTTITL